MPANQTDRIESKELNGMAATLKPNKLPPLKDPNLTSYEQMAVALSKKQPNLSVAEIGKALVDIGVSPNEKYIYSRLEKNDYFKGELSVIENAQRERLIRETYPIAEEVVEEALSASNRKLNLKGKFPYVKLVYDKVHGETHKHVAAPTINVANIERMQVIINNDLDSTLSKATDEP